MIRNIFAIPYLLLLMLFLAAACTNQEQPVKEKKEPISTSSVGSAPEITPPAKNNPDRQIANRLTEKLALYLDGYHSMHQKYPQDLEDLEDDRYFFSLKDMAEVVPDSYEAHVVLGAGSGSYQFIVFRSEATSGYLYQGPNTKKPLSPVTREELTALSGRYQELSRYKSTVFYGEKS